MICLNKKNIDRSRRSVRIFVRWLPLHMLSIQLFAMYPFAIVMVEDCVVLVHREKRAVAKTACRHGYNSLSFTLVCVACCCGGVMVDYRIESSFLTHVSKVYLQLVTIDTVAEWIAILDVC